MMNIDWSIRDFLKVSAQKFKKSVKEICQRNQTVDTIQSNLTNQTSSSPDIFFDPDVTASEEDGDKFFEVELKCPSQPYDHQKCAEGRRKSELARKKFLFQRNLLNQRKFIKEFQKNTEEKISTKGKNIEEYGVFRIKNRSLCMNFSDFQKLSPQIDLNDTIMENYIGILKSYVFDPELVKKTMFFSTFFFHKLLGSNQVPKGRNSAQFIRDLVQKNYSRIQKWTKNEDIFEKDYLVFPLNFSYHWNCIIVLFPSRLLSTSPTQGCSIIYLDSLFYRKQTEINLVRSYLEVELLQKKGLRPIQKIETYQFLLPKQTNAHDCGLYVLSYIEHFFLHEQKLRRDFSVAQNREHLEIFPISLIQDMRNQLEVLFIELMQKKVQKEKEEVVEKYIRLRAKKRPGKELGWKLDEDEWQKYAKLAGKQDKDEEELFNLRIQFYLDKTINYF